MRPHQTSLYPIVAIALVSVFCSGCAMDTYQNRGATFGALSGAAVGTAVGAHNDNALLGTALGALGGAAVGSAVGAGIDSEVTQATYQAQYETEAGTQNALDQVVLMSQQGVSEDVIIRHIQSTGVPRTPNATEIIRLKQSGVSDRVITELQTAGTSARVIRTQPGPIVVEEYHGWGPPAYCPPYGPAYYRRGFGPRRTGVHWGFSYHR